MSTSGRGLAVVVALVCFPRPASAETKEELTRELETWVDFVPDPTKLTTARELVASIEPFRCIGVISRATRLLAADEELVSRSFGGHLGARQVGDAWAVKVADLEGLCDPMTDRLLEARLIGILALSKRWEELVARGVTDDDRRLMTAAEARLTHSVTQACQMLTMVVTRAPDVRQCETMVKWDDLYQAEWKKQLAVFARQLEDAGIGGQRLALLLDEAPIRYYAPATGGWMIEGCKRVRSLKQLKKAKELIWVQTDIEQQIGVVRYQLKGDTLVTRKQEHFPTEKAAFKTRCKI